MLVKPTEGLGMQGKFLFSSDVIYHLWDSCLARYRPSSLATG